MRRVTGGAAGFIAAVALAVLTVSRAGAVEIHVPIAKHEAMLFADDPTQWSRPRVIVPPAYPKALLGRGVTGYVDVEAKLSNRGVVQQIVAVRSVPPTPEFENSVRDVISYWHFHEKLSPDCVPVESISNTRIWFEIKEGKESVSVSSAAQADPSAPGSTRLRNAAAVAKEMQTRYPREARRQSVEGAVYLVLTVDGDSGKTVQVEASHVIAPADLKAAFQRSAVDGVQFAEFLVGDEHRGRKLKVCKTVSYHLSR